jgi:hypothetical protein
MSYDFTLQFRETHVLVQLAPDFVLYPPELPAHWAKIIGFCKEHECYKVLSLANNPQRRMSTFDAYDSGKLASSGGVTLKIACYWKDYQTDELTQFFLTVAANRGMIIEYFSSLAEAQQWLGINEVEHR